MTFSRGILLVMAFFMVLAGLDRVTGNHLKLGAQFEEGIKTFAPLFLSMTGFLCVAPVLAKLLAPIVTPLYTALGADPAMFAGSLLAIDMGGYPLAMEMASEPEIGALSGILLGSMLGAAIVALIPLTFAGSAREDRRYLCLGLLCGIVTIPFGTFAGGLAAGMAPGMLLKNLVPVLLLAAILGAGLALLPKWTVRVFRWFGTGVTFLSGIGMIAAMAEELTGFSILPGMTPVGEAVQTCGSIAIVLAGAYPLVTLLLRALKKPLGKAGRRLGINETAVGGLMTNLVNSIPVIALTKEMDPLGKIVNFACMVGAGFTFGDHLGFTAGVDREMLLPMLTAKLTAGLLALLLAFPLGKRMLAGENKAADAEPKT